MEEKVQTIKQGFRVHRSKGMEKKLATSMFLEIIGTALRIDSFIPSFLAIQNPKP